MIAAVVDLSQEFVVGFLVVQLIGAIGWAIKVQVRLAGIEKDVMMQAHAISEQREDFKAVVERLDVHGTQLARIEETQKHILNAVEGLKK